MESASSVAPGGGEPGKILGLSEQQEERQEREQEGVLESEGIKEGESEGIKDEDEAPQNLEESVFLANLKGSANVSELLASDAEDESLRKYKESLLGAAAHGDLGDVSDPRKVVLTRFVIAFEPSQQGLEDLVFDLDDKGMALLASDGITLKEGAQFKFRISFRVQHEIVVGLKFVYVVSRLMFSEKEELMIGSYPPGSAPFTFEFPKWEYNTAPSGMMFRGKYKVRCCFYVNGTVLTEFSYPLNIVK